MAAVVMSNARRDRLEKWNEKQKCQLPMLMDEDRAVCIRFQCKVFTFCNLTLYGRSIVFSIDVLHAWQEKVNSKGMLKT